MTQSVPVIYYDGVISRPHEAQMYSIDAESVDIQYEDRGFKSVKIHRDHMTLIGALGQKNPVIELQNDGRIELLSRDLPEWLNLESKTFNRRIWKLERSPSLILFSVVFVVALGFSALKWGIPFVAKVVAFQLPQNTLQTIGNKAEKYVIDDLTGETTLAKGQQEQIKREYLDKIAEGSPAKIIFREGGRFGANALALPNNTIIVTDQLVEMAHSDQEILGVLAHEQGHLVERHSLQQALSSLGFSVLWVAVTGDSSDLVTTIPVAVIGAGYSRKFEQQADLYALKLMDKKHIEVAHFANFLQRMEDEESAADEKDKKGDAQTKKPDPKADKTGQTKKADHQIATSSATGEPDKKDKLETSIFDTLSSHPATAERVQMVRDFEKQQQLRKAQ